MKEPKDFADSVEHPDESKGLRVVHSEKQESLLPDPELKALIERMRQSQERVKVKFDEGPEAA